MASELHDRLEYLVNYSSQLIFVSGDSIAQQQRTLESFVFQQADNTELAFITATELMQVSDYRRDVCRQLLGQVVGSYIRPLNELLASLNHHNGPVLITITNAQHLPNPFLQELWDLVLQSRFANNKQHLNVLLFGESQWAEQAKQWLPAKNTDTPLLISSQSVTRDSYSSDIDKLLAERRAAFDRYRQSKGKLQVSNPANPLRSPWFILAITLVFLSSFAALLGWQYGTTLSTLFNPIEQSAPLTEKTVADVLQVQDTVAPTTISVSRQTDETSSAMSEGPDLQPANTTVMTSFDVALDSISEPDDKDNATAALTVGSTSSKQTNLLSARNQQIISAPIISQAPLPEEAVTGVDTIANTTDKSNARLISPIEGVEPAQYYIQIAGMKDLDLAKDFLRDHNLVGLVSFYTTRRDNADWFVLLWHESASTLLQARTNTRQLPRFPGRDNVFVKSGRQIQRELNRMTDLSY